MKLDSPEARAVAKLLNDYDPQLRSICTRPTAPGTRIT
jgi:hypothetical protein